jgi:hypothetical protein
MSKLAEQIIGLYERHAVDFDRERARGRRTSSEVARLSEQKIRFTKWIVGRAAPPRSATSRRTRRRCCGAPVHVPLRLQARPP